MIAKRLVGFVLIDEGYTDVEIAKILHTTRPTVGRFRWVYKRAVEKNDPVVKVVEKLKTSDVVKEVIKDILFKYALPAAFGRIPKKGLF